MSVADLTNDGYALKSVVADLGQIKRSNGYWTDVDTVDLPNYEPSNEGHWLLCDQASVHVWVDKDFQDASRENSSNYNPIMRLAVRGVRKAPEELQIALIKLKTDIRRVFMSNTSREFPGLANPSNNWAWWTEQAPGVPIEYFYHPDNTGSLLGFWDVFYSSPLSG